jgi:hypothetical protein
MAHGLRTALRGVKGWSIVPPAHREQLQGWLAHDVDVCVVPSRADNYPNVILEAARAGCAIVCSDGGGMPEVLSDYRIDANVFASGSIEGLADSILRAVRRVRAEPRLRSQLAAEFERTRRERCSRTRALYDEMASTEERQVARSLPADTPSVVVLIACPDVTPLVSDSVRSAFESRYREFEVVLTTDQSQSAAGRRSLNVLRAAFPALRILEGSGRARADLLNLGLRATKSDCVVTLEPGDRLRPDFLERCSDALARRASLAFVTTYSYGGASTGTPAAPGPLAQPLGVVEALMLFENTLAARVVMYRRSALESAGEYSTSLPGLEDWDLWLTMDEQGLEGDVIPEVLADTGGPPNGAAAGRDSGQGATVRQMLLRRHRRFAEKSALEIAAIALREQWTSTGRPGGDAAHNLEQAWRFLKSGLLKLGRESRDPLGLAVRWRKKVVRQVEEFATNSQLPERVRQ